MDEITKKFRGDRVIWMIFMCLCFISIIEVYSASSMLTFNTHFWQPILKHTSILLGGVALTFLLAQIMNPKYFLNHKVFLYLLLSLIIVWSLLIATLYWGKTVNEANRNLFGFQTSEFAKLSLIPCVAFILSRKKDKASENLCFGFILILTIITCALIVKDNFSTAAILYCVIIVLMFIGQVSFKKIAKLLLVSFLVLLLLFSFIWFFPETAKSLGLNRAVTWIERLKDYKSQPDIRKGNYKITDDNYQVSQAKIAIARGRIFGVFPGNSQQRDFLPQAYSDFIYAIIIEEWGIAGGILVLSLYLFLFIRAGTIAQRCKKLFPRLLVIGYSLMIVIQALVNMAVTVGLMPVTGQPLPLISKGGSSIIVSCAFIGIILGVSQFENPREVVHEEITEEESTDEKQLVIANEQLDLKAAI